MVDEHIPKEYLLKVKRLTLFFVCFRKKKVSNWLLTSFKFASMQDILCKKQSDILWLTMLIQQGQEISFRDTCTLYPRIQDIQSKLYADEKTVVGTSTHTSFYIQSILIFLKLNESE